MAAQAWIVPTTTKKLLGEGSIILNTGNFKLVLVITDAGGVYPSESMSALTWGSLKTDGVEELVSAGNYSTSGIAMTNVGWSISGSTYIFDADDISLSANGVDHLNIRMALIRQSNGDRVICFSSLSSASFDVSSGNKLTITMAAGGLFTLN